MISKEVFKEIIIKDEKFITQSIKSIIERESVILPSQELKKVCVFYGVRRSGKSFVLFDLFRKNSFNSLYIDFEDERLQDLETKDLDKIREAFFELKPHLLNKDVYFLFDEIQNVELWEKFVRRLVEKENIKVFCAGSSSEITPQRIHSSLRGRSWSIGILPFSFREFSRAKGIDTNRGDIFYSDDRIIIKNLFKEYLRYGGFPEVVFAPTEFERKKIIKEYMGSMFFKDLVERFRIKNIALLDVLWDKLFSSFSTKFSLTSFYKQYKDKFPFSKDTLFSYYKYFLDSMLISEVRKFSESTYKRMRNPAKIYLVDWGLSRKVTSQDFGRLLENVVFLELKRRDFEIFYFEEKKECDFIVRKDDNLSAYQVSWEINDSNREREIGGAIKASKYLSLKEATIVTFDQEETLKTEDTLVRIIPVWKWLLEK